MWLDLGKSSSPECRLAYVHLNRPLDAAKKIRYTGTSLYRNMVEEC